MTPLRLDPSPSLWGCRSRRARRGCDRCPSRPRSSPSGSAGPWCRSAGSDQSGPRVAPHCHPKTRREKYPGAALPCSAFPPSKAGEKWVGVLGWKQEGARLDPQRVERAQTGCRPPPLTPVCLSACLSACLRRLVSSGSLLSGP